MSDEIELKPCPFCGGEAVMRRDEVGGLYYIRCANLGCGVYPQTFVQRTASKAADAWNRRAERTCKPLPSDDCVEEHYVRYHAHGGCLEIPWPYVRCSACGCNFPIKSKYCPNCGARVVTEDE